MGYSKTDLDILEQKSDIRDFIPGVRSHIATQYVQCPNCMKEGKDKGLCVTHKGKTNIAKCFSCGFVLAGSIAAEKYFAKCTFPEAVKHVADRYNHVIESEEEQRRRTFAYHKTKVKKSFCAKQLESSGLTIEDVMVVSNHNGVQKYLPAFTSGSIDKFGNINESDDEMLIHYYDLNGHPMVYTKSGRGGKMLPYIRIRWSNPYAHKDKNGRDSKYFSPQGAPTRLYIPQFIRSKYQTEQHIETLIIQEGEKKAEKACKHGIPSVGIQGIFNIGNEESGLIQDIQYIVQKCSVHNVVLLFDSDWDHLSEELHGGDEVDSRPNSFSKAAIKFKQYVLTLHRIGASVDIHFGHIKQNSRGDKGIDDLLVGELAGKEESLAKDIEDTLLTHDGKGTYVNIYKITAKTDNQIRDYWQLNDSKEFFETHRERLVKLPNFRFGKMSYRVDDDKIVQSSKTSDREFWTVYRDEKNKERVEFDSYEALEFVSANGFYRIHTADMEGDTYKFVRIDEGIVHPSGPTEIRDFVFAYMLQATKNKTVRDFFASRLGNLLSVDKLERVTKVEDNFEHFSPYLQHYYYNNGQVDITAEGIKHSPHILGQVWVDKVRPRSFRRVPIVKEIRKNENGEFEVYDTKESDQCEFYQFLKNSSDFWSPDNLEMTDEDQATFQRHLVNKLTTIGYLLVDYKYRSESKAVIAMDGQLGEVGDSNGRTGKSLIGLALEKMMAQTYVDGRHLKNDDDYIYSGVTIRTRNIFIDDVKERFDFDNFFGSITGDLNVNPKTMARFSIKFDRSPKILISTNHAINSQSRSAKDRIAYMAFSSYYNEFHKPIDDFGHEFFNEWDEEQWNLFDNLMLECCMFYLQSREAGWHRRGMGAVPPPMKDIDKRTQRQLMGESFYQWAEVYYDKDSMNINQRIPRMAIYQAYKDAFPGAQAHITPTMFKRCVKTYCKFKGYHFNANMPSEGKKLLYSSVRNQMREEESFIGGDDKVNSVEYFTVSTTEYSDKQGF